MTEQLVPVDDPQTLLDVPTAPSPWRGVITHAHEGLDPRKDLASGRWRFVHVCKECGEAREYRPHDVWAPICAHTNADTPMEAKAAMEDHWILEPRP